MLIRKIINIVLLSMIPVLSISQEKLTKSEIYSMVCYIEENRNKIKENFDSSVVAIVDSLKILKIDTIGIFRWTSYGSFLRSNIKRCDESLWSAYIHWIKNGLSYHQEVNENCTFGPKQINNSELINFYINNRIAINDNRIMPGITKVTLNEKGKYILSFVETGRTASYTIFCELHGNSTVKSFRNDYFENEENIFHHENNTSIIKRWWKLTENQINKIEEKGY